MKQASAVAILLLAIGCGISTFAQDAGKTSSTQLHVRLENSAVYGQGASVPLAAALLKRRTVSHADGGGTLAAVLLLTNRPGFDCRTDPDLSLASQKEFILGVSLYETFTADEGPERTLLHQMVFSGPGEAAESQSQLVILQWQGNAAVVYRHGAGKAEWQAMKMGREQNGLTISGQGDKMYLTLDYSDGDSSVKGRVTPVRCP